MVRNDPNLQKKALPGEIAIRGDLKPAELKEGEAGPIDKILDGPLDRRFGRLPDPGTAGIFRDDDGKAN